MLHRRATRDQGVTLSGRDHRVISSGAGTASWRTTASRLLARPICAPFPRCIFWLDNISKERTSLGSLLDARSLAAFHGRRTGCCL